MELEQLIVAKEIQAKLENYKESIQHIEEIPLALKYDIYIAINDGWGTQRIYIPKEVVNDALDIIKKSLEERIKELECQFKEL